MRRAARVDDNQGDIVKALRAIPGVSVEVGHDDILVGYRGGTFWFEIKRPDCVSKKTGWIKKSEVTKAEIDRHLNWPGHYTVVWTLDQILDDLGITI